MTSRICLVSKSPHTGTIFESNMGGAFGPELKYAGYDGIIIKGQADSFVYLKILDGQVTIEDATGLQGQGVFATEKQLEEIAGSPDAKCLSIGPAGENLLSYAIIGGDAYRQFGRGGSGALFGSKNLKGIVCRGTGAVQAADMGKFLERIDYHKKTKLLIDDQMWVSEDGTPGTVDTTNELGIHPTRNFREGTYEKHSKINSDAVKEAKLGDRACGSCPMACGKYTRGDGVTVEGPEYETLCLAGSNCDVDDLGKVIHFNYLCDDLGIDTMSGAATISLAMEMNEEGRADLGIRFGQADEYLKILHEIAHLSTERGRDLAMGSKKLAEKYQAHDLSMEVKGLELPAYEPRGNYGMGLAYATSERGACHLRAYTAFANNPFDIEDMTRQVVDGQNFSSIKFSMCFCEFWETLTPEVVADLLSAGLGKEVTVDELLVAGERIWNLNRLFNLKAGFTAADDRLPEKAMKRQLKKGLNDGRVFSAEDFASSKQLYYRLRDWDTEGVPSAEKLAALGLTELAAGKEV
jgi:aldehyde:ferredoxin oxidoreductase